MTSPSPAGNPPPAHPPAGYLPPGYYPAPGQSGAPPAGYGPPGHPPPGWHPPAYTPPPPAVSPGGQPLASFLDRFLAYLLDGVVFTAVVMVIALPPFFIVFFNVLPDLQVDEYGQPVDFNPFDVVGPLLLLELGLVVFSLLLAYVYYVEMMFRSGQTLGKKVMKIRVVPLDPAARLDRPKAAKRYLAQHVAAVLVPFYSYLDGLWQLWDKPYQQCLHDKFAETVVVKVG